MSAERPHMFIMDLQPAMYEAWSEVATAAGMTIPEYIEAAFRKEVAKKGPVIEDYIEQEKDEGYYIKCLFNAVANACASNPTGIAVSSKITENFKQSAGRQCDWSPSKRGAMLHLLAEAGIIENVSCCSNSAVYRMTEATLDQVDDFIRSRNPVKAVEETERSKIRRPPLDKKMVLVSLKNASFDKERMVTSAEILRYYDEMTGSTSATPRQIGHLLSHMERAGSYNVESALLSKSGDKCWGVRR